MPSYGGMCTVVNTHHGDRAPAAHDLAVQGAAFASLTLDDYARFISDERKMAERIVKDSGLQPE
jgi:hypothetical protein